MDNLYYFFRFVSSKAFPSALSLLCLAICCTSFFLYQSYKKKYFLHFFIIVAAFFVLELAHFSFFFTELFSANKKMFGDYMLKFFVLKAVVVIIASRYIFSIYLLKRRAFYTPAIAGGIVLGTFIAYMISVFGEVQITFSPFRYAFEAEAIMLLIFIILNIAGLDVEDNPDIGHLILNRFPLIFFLALIAIGNLLFIHSSTDTLTSSLNKFSMYVNLAAMVTLVMYSNSINDIERVQLAFNVESLNKEKRMFSNLNHTISAEIVKTDSISGILQVIGDVALETTQATGFVIWLYDREEKKFKAEVVEGNFPPLREVQSYVMEKKERIINRIKNDHFDYGDTYVGIVAETKLPFYYNDLLNKPHPSIKQTMSGVIDIKSVIAMPIIIKEECIGVMAIINKNTPRSNFSPADYSMMDTLTDQVALACNQFNLNKEQLSKKMAEREVGIAGEIQRNLLPDTFDGSKHIDLYGFSYAAKGVGGDYFDYKKFSDKEYGIIMSDVAGKGVPASLVMVILRSTFRIMAGIDSTPESVISALNNSIAGEVSQERYATCFYYTFDAVKKEIRYANAAHGPLLVYRAKHGEFEEFDTQGIPLGIMKDSPYEEKKTKVTAGDILVLYTDGITEAMNIKRFQYGVERLKKQIIDNKDASAQEISDIINRDVNEFVDTAPQHDDQTLFIVKILD